MAPKDLTASQLILAANVIRWLTDSGCGSVSYTVKDTEILIHYTLKHDILPQPSIRITPIPSVVFPKGSQELVTQLFMATGLK